MRNISIALKFGSASRLERAKRGGVRRKELSEYLSLIKNDKVVKS
jgi:hypothetical protein